MTLTTVTTLLLMATIAVVAPLLADSSGPLRMPGVVIELLLGIVIGPQVLGIAHLDGVTDALSYMGLATLMFLAGYELDLGHIKGRPLRLAAEGWLVSLVLAGVAALVLVSSGLALDRLVIGLALTTTALGTLLPVLRDAGVLDGPFGVRMLAIGTVGEFGPVVAVAVLLDHRNPAETGGLLALFVVVAVAAALVATKPQPPRVVAVMRRHLQSSAQLPVRVSVLLLVALTYLAFRLGLDVLLGAFAAGIVVRLFAAGRDSAVIRGKLEAIGFGFLVPIFFVASGMRFDGRALVDHPSTFLRLPLFLVLFLVVRGLPAFLLYREELPRSELVPLALFSATGLPLIVVITSIGVSEGRMAPANAAALVGAGILSVVICPAVGLRLLPGDPRSRAAPRRRDVVDSGP